MVILQEADGTLIDEAVPWIGAFEPLPGDKVIRLTVPGRGSKHAANAYVALGPVKTSGVMRFPRERFWQSGAHNDPGAATLSVVGMTAWTIPATVVSDDGSAGPWLNSQTGSVSGDASGPNGPASYRAECGVDATFRVKVSDTANVRLWAGLCSSNPSGSDTPSNQMAGFRYSTAAGDTTWNCYTRGAGSGTTTDSGIPVATGAFTLRMVLTGTLVQFWIGGLLVATHTTHLPTATMVLAPYVRVTTLTTAAKNVGFGGMSAWSR